MIGPCQNCRFWKYKNTVHQDWGHCKRTQEMSENDYANFELSEDKPRFVAIGSLKQSGMLATQATFKCNEFQEK